MNLETLRGLSDLTLDQIRARDPQLASDLLRAVRGAETSRLNNALSDLPAALRAQVAQIDLTQSPGDVLDFLRTRLGTLRLTQAQVDDIVARAQSAGVGRGLSAAQRVGADPTLAAQISSATLEEVVTVAGLSTASTATVLQSIGSVTALDENGIAGLVTQRKLTDAEARTLGFSNALYAMVDQYAAMATKIRTTAFPRLGGAAPTSTADLALLSPADWTVFFRSAGVRLPSGITVESAGEALASRLAVVHPGLALSGRFPQAPPAAADALMSSVDVLFRKNRDVIGTSFDQLDTSDVDRANVAAVRAAHAQLVAMAAAYPGLQLASVLNDPSLTAAAKAAALSRRIGLIQNAGATLGDEEVFRLNLTAGSPDIAKLGLGGLGATAPEQQMVLETYKAYQRVWAVAKSVDDTVTLVARGYASANDVARQPYATFCAQSGLSDEKAEAMWNHARTSMADVSLSAAAVLDVMHGLFDRLAPGNQPPTVQQYLKQIAGYEDLFGSLTFCDCAECQSIIGPAAYFVDLMKFIDENLRNQFPHPNHPLDLKTRRPDLWTLPLTCDNTNNLVATLDIVNEVLENFIALRLGYAGSLDDRTQIGALVYEATLSSEIDSIRQPFHLPLARIRSYLAGLGRKRLDVAAAVAAPEPVRTFVALDLSPLEAETIGTLDPNLLTLSHIYGIAFGGTTAAAQAVDAAALGPAMGLSRDSLGLLIETSFVSSSGTNLVIQAAKRNSDSVQNDVEWVQGLTADALDRMHRFTRLMWKTEWSVQELDLVLTTLGEQTLGSQGLQNVAQFHAMQASYGISVAEACALVGAIPQAPAGRSLFDKLFNPPSFVAPDGPFPKPATHFVDPAFRSATPAPVDPAVPRLLTGLSVQLDGLTALSRHLAAHLAQEQPGSHFDPNAANDDDRYFVLSAANLALLYRHARLARLLRLTIDDLFQLLGFAGLDHIGGLADLQRVLDLWGWWSGFRLDDVAVATGGTPRDPARYPDPVLVANDLAASAAAALTFTDTMFSVALAATEQGSLDLLVANPGLVESLDGGKWRLQAGVDPGAAPITIPPGAVVPTPPSGTRMITEEEVRTALTPYLSSEALLRSLESALKISREKIVALAGLAARSLMADDLARAVRGDGPIDPLIALIGALRPLHVLLAAAAWDASAINFVAQHQAVFGPDPFPQNNTDALHPNVPFVSLDQVRWVAAYQRIASRSTPGGTGIEPADLQAALSGFIANPAGFPASTDAAMARVLGVPGSLVVGLRGRVTLPPVAAAALDQMDQAAQLAATIGVDGQTFGDTVSTDYDTLSHAADALYAALGAVYTDEQSRSAKLEETEQPVRAAKRDALTDYLQRSITPKLWSTPDDLYQYFLMDVSAGGCAQTSRLVAATMSAQLYVHRAIMNLEQDGLPPTNASHFALRMPPDASEEWEWRANYRVWQANRKVFLWPENYLDPDLRDDKTPLFSDLEQTLLQTNLTDQNVLDAYTTYLAGFEEVSSLTIAGVYHDRPTLVRSGTSLSEIEDVLHLFGVSSTDPPVYYYRTCRNLVAHGRDPNIAAVWSPWRKMTVQITGRRVSPVVHNKRLHVFWIDIRTKSTNVVKDGASTFDGYSHTITLKFTTLRSDGSWTAPQQVNLKTLGHITAWYPAAGQVPDKLINNNGVAPLDPEQRMQAEASDSYTLSGPNWDWAWPLSANGKLYLDFRNFNGLCMIDVFGRNALGPSGLGYMPMPYPQLLQAKNENPKTLYSGVPGGIPATTPSSWANLTIDEDRIKSFELEQNAAGVQFYDPLLRHDYHSQIATIPNGTDLIALPGSIEDALVQVGGDVLLLQGSVTDDSRYILSRLGTTLVEDIARRLFEDGIDGLLDIHTQLALAEAGLPIDLIGKHIVDRSNTGTLDFAGAYGVYYQELFFHIPFLIANALNSRGSFESAQRWYQFIFDPTAAETIDVTGVPPGEVAHRLLDRVWRYRQFRGLGIETLRDVLTDTVAIELYRSDPFNPWAIARRRLSAFQKAIVMKYVDNLLDWGDSLFTQFTMESVNEATMLYIMAADVLGPRPTKLGNCGTGIAPMTYEVISPLVNGSSEMLIELETWTIGARVSKAPTLKDTGVNALTYTIAQSAMAHAVNKYAFRSRATMTVSTGAGSTFGNLGASGADEKLFRGLGWTSTRTASWAPALSRSTIQSDRGTVGRATDAVWKGSFAQWAGRFAFSIIRQLTPVFCVPVNSDLLAYWDRVEDRLFKIRNCMNIDGEKATLALFAPPINPMELVAMKAAGLSLSDVLGAGNGNLPPYRFLYLIERAKAFAAALSGFGASLLGSLEKKDGEQINRLRLSQQMNLAQLTSQVRQLEIDAASETVESVSQQIEAAQYRRDFYKGLMDEFRNGWETGEADLRWAIAGTHVGESVLDTLAASFALIPETGSPFAMKYGGVELNTSIQRYANAANAVAEGMTAMANALSMQGNFDRRREGWNNMKTLAEYDLKMFKRQLKAAQIRLDIANRSLTIHEKSIDQIQELLDITDGKFTNLGLYTWTSTQLQRIYRNAYQNALALAKLAERAYRFERGDDTLPGLALTYWDPARAGLLAGEQLLCDLQTLERRFIETNYRTLEIDQAFSLSQIDAAALVDLRETGECAFTIDEVFFNIFYPGGYRRRIKAIRLTIPCVTGPYVNVAATLHLERSWIRTDPTPGGQLVEVPPTRSVTIATSTAQSDAGVFDVSFRDERYMPFEGLGAICRLRLTLAKAFRQFDYQTINDVVVAISYTALYDGALRDRVESDNAALEGGLLNYFSDNPAKKMFSLRQDFSSAFTRLLRSPAGTPVKIEISDRNFPLFFTGRDLTVTRGLIALRTAAGLTPSNFQINIDGTAVNGFNPDPTLGELPAKSLPGAFSAALRSVHTMVVEAAGALAPGSSPPGDASAVDPAKLLDIVLYIEYQLA